MALDTVYNRFDASKNWKSIDFIPGRRLQSAELNELQSISEFNLKSWASKVFGDFALIEGCDVEVTILDTYYRGNGDVPYTNLNINISEGIIYYDGSFYKIGPQNITTTMREYHTGIWLECGYKTVNSDSDSSLLDVAKGYDNYLEKGANRKVLEYSFLTSSGSDGYGFDDYINVEWDVIKDSKTVYHISTINFDILSGSKEDHNLVFQVELINKRRKPLVIDENYRYGKRVVFEGSSMLRPKNGFYEIDLTFPMDVENYSYSVDILLAVAIDEETGEEMTATLQPVLMEYKKKLIIGRQGIAVNKMIMVEFRILEERICYDDTVKDNFITAT